MIPFIPPSETATVSFSEARYKTMEHLKANGIMPGSIIWAGEKDEVRGGKPLKRITVWRWGKDPQRIETWIEANGEVYRSIVTTPHGKVKALTRFNGTQEIEAAINPNGTASLIAPQGTVFEAFNDYPLDAVPAVTTLSGTDFGDGSGYIDVVQPPPGTYPDFLRSNNALTPAAEIMFGIQTSYKFYAKFLDRNGITGDGSPVKAYAHVGFRYDNAFYAGGLCDCIYLGDGSYPISGYPSGATNLTSIDVVAHELAHGITEHSSQLDYFGESGGLNEANSDIIGKAVEWWAEAGFPDEIPTPTDPAKWVIGEKILYVDRKPRALRWFSQPSLDGYSYDYANDVGIGWDDPHFTSGPLNRWFYYASVGIPRFGENPSVGSKYVQSGYPYPIGVTKAVRIWNRANTHYLNFVSDYPEAYAAARMAAQELYGQSEVEAIDYTFAAIGARDPGTLPPLLASIYQQGHEVGDRVTINGNAFTGASWFIGDNPVPPASITAVNDTQATLIIPPNQPSGTVTAQNQYGRSAHGVELVVYQAPVIESLDVTPKSFQIGDTVTVTWSTKRTTSVKLNGFDVGASGRATFTPAGTMDFRLEAFGVGNLIEIATVRATYRTLDLNGDGVLDLFDPLLVVANWGANGATDLNGDGITDEIDFYNILARIK